MRELKFKLKDPTLTSDVNQTLSNLLSQVNKTNKAVGGVSVRVTNNTKAITVIQSGGGGGGSSTPPPGTAVTPIAYPQLTGSGGLSSPFDAWNTSVITRIPGSTITAFPTASKITIRIQANGTSNLGKISGCTVARTLVNNLAVVDHTPITFGGTSSPTLGVGTFTSDVITLAIDPLHDYYFIWFGVFVSFNDVFYVGTTAAPFQEGGRTVATSGTGPGGAGDYTTNTSIPVGILAGAGAPAILNWVAA